MAKSKRPDPRKVLKAQTEAMRRALEPDVRPMHPEDGEHREPHKGRKSKVWTFKTKGDKRKPRNIRVVIDRHTDWDAPGPRQPLVLPSIDVAIGDGATDPAHYKDLTPEPWDVIEGWGLGFNLGNVVKYIARAGRKGSRQEDLRKAAKYLAREIERGPK